MKRKKAFWLGLVANLTITPLSWAQAPAVPAVPAAAPAAAAGAPNLWSFLLPSAEQKAACKTHFCNSSLGKMTNSMISPISSMSGGLIQNRCVQNAIANDLKKPAENPDGLAARVKADEVEAKARRASVRFLSTVDCNYWPEAIETFKLALRKDRNECVRYEAALALGNGCCCNNEIIDALKNAVMGESKTDPHPVERSDRVRAAAAEALARCVMTQPPELTPDKQQKTDATPIPNVNDYYKKLAQTPRDQVVAGARAVLVSLQQGGKSQPVGTGTAATPALAVPAVTQRTNSLSGIVSNAFTPSAPSVVAADSGNQSRSPFFASLTKTLTGKQENTYPIRQEIEIPYNNPVARVREPFMVVPTQITPSEPNGIIRVPVTPEFVPEVITPPLPNIKTNTGPIREIKMIGPVEIAPPTKIIDSTVIQPLTIKAVGPVETIPAPQGGVSFVGRSRETQVVAPLQVDLPAPRAVPALVQPSVNKKSAPVEIIQSAPTNDRPRESTGVVTVEVIPPAPSLGSPGVPPASRP